MVDNTCKIGFSYFTSSEYLLINQIEAWLPALHRWGGTRVVIDSNFDRAVPEDFFLLAHNNDLTPIVHFKTCLPSAKNFNECALLLDLYQRWGVTQVVLGNQPNNQKGWPMAAWHYEAFVDTFLDRFIPLANHAVRIGLQPILGPLQPGGDYWDSAFLEMALTALKNRKMDALLDTLMLSSYGYTFDKPLSWGEGGPERWPGSKPYFTPDGQEDQLGFHNYEWVQAVSQRVTGKPMPVIILDAGRPDEGEEQIKNNRVASSIKTIFTAIANPQSKNEAAAVEITPLDEQVLACFFSLDTLKQFSGEQFSIDQLDRLFSTNQKKKDAFIVSQAEPKIIAHYLLLPVYGSGVPDVVLNKVRPLIKNLRPTVGFSFEEASRAAKVSIYPDPYLFSEDQINQLRLAGCKVEILPQSGMEIATLLQP
jgi:hypothetical protein